MASWCSTTSWNRGEVILKVPRSCIPPSDQETVKGDEQDECVVVLNQPHPSGRVQCAETETQLEESSLVNALMELKLRGVDLNHNQICPLSVTALSPTEAHGVVALKPRSWPQAQQDVPRSCQHCAKGARAQVTVRKGDMQGSEATWLLSWPVSQHRSLSRGFENKRKGHEQIRML